MIRYLSRIARSLMRFVAMSRGMYIAVVGERIARYRNSKCCRVLRLHIDMVRGFYIMLYRKDDALYIETCICRSIPITDCYTIHLPKL